MHACGPASKHACVRAHVRPMQPVHAPTTPPSSAPRPGSQLSTHAWKPTPTEPNTTGKTQVTQKLLIVSQGQLPDDYPPEGQRSPSPEPMYNEAGLRSNTREQRLREKLLRQKNVRVSVGVWCHGTSAQNWGLRGTTSTTLFARARCCHVGVLLGLPPSTPQCKASPGCGTR